MIGGGLMGIICGLVVCHAWNGWSLGWYDLETFLRIEGIEYILSSVYYHN